MRDFFLFSFKYFSRPENDHHLVMVDYTLRDGQHETSRKISHAGQANSSDTLTEIRK